MTNKYKFQIPNFKSVLIGLLVIIGTYWYVFGIEEASAQSSIPLVVSPARQTVAIDPGRSQSLSVKFFNQSSVPMVGSIKAIDFYVAGKDGAPILLDDSVNPWIKLPFDRAAIASGDVLNVSFQVNIPKDANPGGRYVAIVFEETGQLPNNTSANESVSSVSPRIVSLLSIRVNGPVTESAFIDVFKVPGFMENGKIPVYAEVLNKGGYHITPIGQFTLTDWFGREIERVTLDEKNIFPDAKRIYETKLGSTWMFGKYKVDMAVAYGTQGKTATISSYIWVIPVTLIIVVTLSILIIALVIYLISKKIKSKQESLEEKLEEEISELESLKNRFKDKMPKA